MRFLIVILSCTFIAHIIQPVPVSAQESDLSGQADVSDFPHRIISLAPTHTEILYALGLQERIVGVTDYCNCPEKAGKKEVVGGFADPDIDRILALKPDLVLAFGTIQRPVVEELEKRKQRVFWTYPHTVDAALQSFETIGTMTGKRLIAEQLTRSIRNRIQHVQEQLADIPEDKRLTVFRVMGLDPLGTIGGDSFQTDVYRLAGGKNVFLDIKKDFFQVDLEALIERDPDVMVVCGEKPDELRTKISNQEGWQSWTAVKTSKIFVISCDLICRPGPKVAETIEKLAVYLYPKRFPREVATGPVFGGQ